MTPVTPLIEQPLIRTGKCARTKEKSWNVGHTNIPKFLYGNTYHQTDPKMRSVPKKYKFGSIHFQTVGIVNDMYDVTAANSETGDVLSVTKEDRGVYIMGVILTQYSLNKGLKEFGESGEQAVMKDLSSNKDMDTFFHMDAEILTKEQRVRDNSSIMFLKEKHDWTIKGRACVISTPQCACIKREDAASSTCTT